MNIDVSIYELSTNYSTNGRFLGLQILIPPIKMKISEIIDVGIEILKSKNAL
jgi:hypothetical protein